MILPTPAFRELKISEVKSFQNEETYNGSTRHYRTKIILHLFLSFYYCLSSNYNYAVMD